MSILSDLFKYNYDPTGTNPKNLVVDEIKTVAPGNVMPIVFREGLFYTEGFVVMPVGSTTPWVKGVDYTWVGLDPDIVADTGLEAAAAIQPKNLGFSGDLKVTYQCVGGPEGRAKGLILDLIEAINKAVLDPTILWENIEGRPSKFPPTPHSHPLSTLTELEKLSQALDDVTNALVNREPMKDSPHHFQEQIDRIVRVQGQMRNTLNKLAAVRGSNGIIAELQRSIELFEETADAATGALVGEMVVLGRWDINAFNTVRGGVSFVGDNDTHAVEFLMTAKHSGSEQLTYFADIYTTSRLFELEASVVGEFLEIRATPSVAGQFKTKWQYVL